MKKICFLFRLCVFFVFTGSIVHGDSADEFFADHLIIDGTANPTFRPGTNLTTFYEDRKGITDFSELTNATGLDVSIMSTSDWRSMERWQQNIDNENFTNIAIIRSVRDLQRVYEGKVSHGVMFYVQKPWPLNGSVRPIEEWFDAGLRVFQITYGEPTHKVSSRDRLGYGTDRGDPVKEDKGLTELGREVIDELNRLGIVVDVSHCNRQTTLDAVAHSKKPVVSSHAGCEALVKHARNKSDEEIRAIAKSGGIFGVSCIGWMLNEKRERASIDDFVEHLEHAIQVAGIDHVAISSDTYRNGWGKDSGHFAGEKLGSEQRWKHLYEALVDKGYRKDDLAKIFGLNWIRVLKAVIPAR